MYAKRENCKYISNNVKEYKEPLSKDKRSIIYKFLNYHKIVFSYAGKSIIFW